MTINEILTSPAVEAAPKLLGCVLKRRTPGGLVALRIVETEAYHQEDPASHSFKWQTVRTAPMFKAGGHIYVYFTYGMHYCVNIVTGPSGRGEAVLLRAGEPLEGTVIMRRNRGGIAGDVNIANGPAKLAQALGINDTKLSGKILNPAPFTGASAIRLPTATVRKRSGASKSGLWLETGQEIKPDQIVTAPRIGITHGTEALLRFYIRDNGFVSRYNKP